MTKIYSFLILAIIFASNVMAQNIPSYVPTNGLVGWWPFNGNANDESGNGNNGIPNGSILTTDRNGNINSAYHFDGMSKISTNAQGPSGISSRTITLWCKFDDIITNEGSKSKLARHPADLSSRKLFY